MNLSTRTKDRENGIRNVAHTSQVRIKGIAGKVREAVLAGAERMPSAKVREGRPLEQVVSSMLNQPA
jgi:hypothetical protein